MPGLSKNMSSIEAMGDLFGAKLNALTLTEFSQLIVDELK